MFTTTNFHVFRLGLFVLILGFCQTLIAQNSAMDSSYVVGEIIIQGNKQTKNHIILRELAFKEGDTLTKKRLLELRAKGMQQIFNLKLFTSVVVEIDPKNKQHVSDIHIYLKERWYLFVIPILEIGDRNFNEWFETKRLDRLNYGARVTRFNMRGRNETVRINIQSGFTRKLSLDYHFPYINKKLTIGAAINFTYSDNKEVWYRTSNNKLQRFRDPDNVLFKRYKSALILNYRRKIYTNHSFISEYNNLSIADTLVKQELNPNYFRNAATQQQSIYNAYNLTYDDRDFRLYALNGMLLSAELGNYTFFSGEQPFIKAQLLTEYHTQLKGRNYFSIVTALKYSSTPNQPYNLYRAFGYDYFVRGFEYSVIDGQNSALAKVNYRFNFLKQRQYSLNNSSLKKFSTIPIAAYAKLYYDAGYVDNPVASADNTFANTYLGGFGAGIDLVTYYDRVVTFEYSFNNKGQRGLFLHFNSTF